MLDGLFDHETYSALREHIGMPVNTSLSEIRDRSFESQTFRASELNLVVSAIVHWITVYLGRAVDHLRQQGRIIRPEVLKHVSPLSWEPINLTGPRLGRAALAG